ncbi:hypothetical protein LKO31_00960 [Sphingopyxis sp. FBM22]|nr:hypothetical protein [Sphingopyxis yananensis]
MGEALLKPPLFAGAANLMAENMNLSFTEDELEMIVDALEADMEGYIEASKEARDAGNKEDVDTFSEAAERIQSLLTRLQPLVG